MISVFRDVSVYLSVCMQLYFDTKDEAIAYAKRYSKQTYVTPPTPPLTQTDIVTLWRLSVYVMIYVCLS